MMIKKWFTLILLASSTFSTSSFAMPLRAQGVQYDIDAKGASTVVSQLIANHHLDEIANKIKLGDDDWIALAPKLAAAHNSQMTQVVVNGLRTALIYNPAAVLRALSNTTQLQVSQICHYPNLATVKEDQQRAINTLTSVRIASLQTTRDACIAQLKQP